jgi:EmrB/QacA subfamily drug resistance transporter
MADTGRARMTQAQRWVLTLASVGSFIVILDVLVVTTALTTIQHDLHASLTSLEWTVNAYSLTFAVLLLTGAAIGDRFGRRRMYVTGLSIFTLMSAACALAPNVGVLIATRAVQGAGAALVMPLALTQISAAFPPEARGRALGIFSGVTGLATFLGPVVGGAVAQGLAWQWIFWINVPVGLVTIPLVLRHIEESRGPNNRLDLPGAVLATGAALGLVWGLVRGNVSGWTSPEVLVALIGGILLGVAFVAWEARTAAPMLPTRFFANRTFSTANAGNFALYASVYGILFVLAQFFQDAQAQGPFAAGVRMIPWTATLVVCAPIAGNLIDRFGERAFMVTGLLLQAVGLAWLALVASPTVAYAVLIPPLIVTGVGASGAMPAAQKAVVGAVEPQDIGKASGAITMLRILGGVFGIAIVTAVFAGTGGFDSPQAFTDGFVPAVFAASAMAVVGGLAALGMPNREQRRRPAAPPTESRSDEAVAARRR